MDESSDPNFKNCKKDIERMTVKEQDMQKLIKTLKEDIEHLESELQGRDETIEKMEKENSDLMKTNQELQKYKHAADVTMQDQKKKIEEQEKDIKEKTEKIQGVQDVVELVKNFQTDLQKCVGLIQGNNVLKKKIRELHARYVQKSDVDDLQKCVGLIQGNNVLKKKIRELHAPRYVQKSDVVDLQKCVGLIQGNNVLKKKIRELHARYVQKSDVPKLVGANVDIHEESDHRKEHLLRTVNTLQRELKDMKETHRVDNIRVMQENVTLRKEIDDLRRELKLSRTKVQEMEKEKALRLSKKNHPLLSADSKGFAGAGRKSSGVLQLKPVEETTTKIVLPQIKIKSLMQPEKKPTKFSSLPCGQITCPEIVTVKMRLGEVPKLIPFNYIQ